MERQIAPAPAQANGGQANVTAGRDRKLYDPLACKTRPGPREGLNPLAFIIQ